MKKHHLIGLFTVIVLTVLIRILNPSSLANPVAASEKIQRQ